MVPPSPGSLALGLTSGSRHYLPVCTNVAYFKSLGRSHPAPCPL